MADLETRRGFAIGVGSPATELAVYSADNWDLLAPYGKIGARANFTGVEFYIDPLTDPGRGSFVQSRDLGGGSKSRELRVSRTDTGGEWPFRLVAMNDEFFNCLAVTFDDGGSMAPLIAAEILVGEDIETMAQAITWDGGLGGARGRFAQVEVNGTKVLGAQGAAVADASGGTNIDPEARAAINALLARVRTHGLIAT